MNDVTALIVPFMALLAIAFVIEGLVEYFVEPPVKKFAPQFEWALPFAALLVALIVGYVYQIDMLRTWFGMPGNVVGIFLTAVVVSRGASYVHSFGTTYLFKTDKLR